MLDKIKKLHSEITSLKINTRQELESYRLKYLSKKGIISSLFEEFRNIPNTIKKETGQRLNELKQTAQAKFDSLKSSLNTSEETRRDVDTTKPSYSFVSGSRHPISIVRREIIDIFSRIGFIVSEGPEIEDDDHVFTKLNFAPEHPARDMQDTFYISRISAEDSNPGDILLRTHTSSVQVRVMQSMKPPIRTISPGRVFRNEAISARAHCIFHQVEGLYIDENVSFSDLKQTLYYFAHELFGKETRIRFRPSYFPFTEPSAEMDLSCLICGGKGCKVCKNTGWLEVLGCGMVHPNVLEACSIDSRKYTGFAFGMGIERAAMLKYQINDLRLYFENDLRFLSQFKSAI
ncbi:MAG TPA: phenylalanine--tRNA ligase subunit alpha [Bacteroidales bacterium]|nr:phenylalanine--tRNA ligase subunit alpha [Bacteroidales bacterium]HNR41296.1 phenylalanine--tRNA ligase subunit alpha [Bacteroidales bacterium]HPM87482.1 phenylalanine--tRNA ligase subunit alpha [Bacteroidales bacterium]HQG76009.1 phenylalanine--tRNA ligase subunit alpha [Bacteroidales bacterium]